MAPKADSAALSLRGMDVTDFIPPAPPTERRKFEEQIATAVPEDYRDLLADTDGFRVSDWVFLGRRARRIVLPDRTYILLAEKTDGTAALCVRKGQQEPIVFYYDEIEDSERPLGTQFVAAVRSVTAPPG